MGRIKKTVLDFASLNYWVVRDYFCLVDSVNAFEPQIQGLSDEQVVNFIMNIMITPVFLAWSLRECFFNPSS